jgi:eukaryotic-like serine/threonine-protein kinase
MAAQIGQMADGFSCASVTVTADGAIRVSGVVSAAEDLDQLRSLAASFGDSGRINLDGVAVLAWLHAWPQCSDLAKVLADTVAQHPGTAPRLDFKIPSLVYKKGDKLVIAATATGAFEGYLYVDYFDNAGDVYHLLPTPGTHNNKLRAGQRVTVGGDQYEIDAPFGPNLVIAISSPTPLFPLPDDEKADVYLPALTKALATAASDAPGEPPVAAYTLINTVAR